MRNKSFMFIIMAIMGISLALPAAGQARWRGWYGAGVFAGGVVVGAAISRPWYYAPAPAYVYPAPVYVYPPPAVVYTAPPPAYIPNQAYAKPDPSSVSKADSKPPAGQMVEVPGQYVNGKWVPSHKAWASDHPKLV